MFQSDMEYTQVKKWAYLRRRLLFISPKNILQLILCKPTVPNK